MIYDLKLGTCLCNVCKIPSWNEIQCQNGMNLDRKFCFGEYHTNFEIDRNRRSELVFVKFNDDTKSDFIVWKWLKTLDHRRKFVKPCNNVGYDDGYKTLRADLAPAVTTWLVKAESYREESQTPVPLLHCAGPLTPLLICDLIFPRMLPYSYPITSIHHT